MHRFQHIFFSPYRHITPFTDIHRRVCAAAAWPCKAAFGKGLGLAPNRLSAPRRHFDAMALDKECSTRAEDPSSPPTDAEADDVVDDDPNNFHLAAAEAALPRRRCKPDIRRVAAPDTASTM